MTDFLIIIAGLMFLVLEALVIPGFWGTWDCRDRNDPVGFISVVIARCPPW
ncbi:MAG: hypothetical protein Ct9H300mP2_0370 [Candidatus Neomarinimicrobiota bacterium]|nr:MAG: hypothetical protein Ct9H300mP2_0370 [Candidatus Neomarinimicrobiota bacterium]